MTTVITEGRRPGEVLVSEASGARSREQITLKSGHVYEPGAVLGQITAGTLTAAGAAVAGNTGAATITAAPAVAATVVPGIYKLTAVSAGAAAAFLLEDPAGITLGEAVTGVAATIAGIGPFTVTDAGTDPAVGDQFTITVTRAAATDTGKYAPYDPAATDGTATAAAVLYGRADATDADRRGVVFARDCEVKREVLTWSDGINDAQKSTAVAALATRDIIAR